MLVFRGISRAEERDASHFGDNRMTFFRHLALLSVVTLAGATPVLAGPSLGLSADVVSETPAPNAFPLLRNKQAATLYVDKADWPGVLRAAGDLQADMERVSGIKPELSNAAASTKTAVIIGTIGKSPLIDALIKAGKIKTDSINGRWESFLIATVEQPLPGVDQALVIAGSDKRGTIYGIYEISEQIGVSPWYWWADVPAKHHEALFIKSGTYLQGPPAVKFRGIFINDEDPALGGWSRAKFGGVNSKMYTHMFELILRCRGNYLWPAMWGKAFNEDDPQNPVLADQYGIVMGTSHHEPLIRAQKEWTTHRAQFGNQWDYLKNEDGLKKFWTEGVTRNKNYENIYTLGMRGDGDVAMPDAGGPEANRKLLEKIIADQQDILRTVLNKKDLNDVPQLWALFTEVQQYYDAGLKLPDNVTLLFTDDNVGNIRRVPTPAERNRLGGAGIYFHMDMNGGPFSYKWLNSNPLPKVWEQMNLVHEYGANQIWIVNVGDLKPLEIPLEFFLRMGWDPDAVGKDKIADYQVKWATREFGPAHAAEIADLVAQYAKYNAMPKPERLRPTTYSLTNYQEAERISQAWNDLAARAQKLNEVIPADQKDAYYQLVLHPVVACATFFDLYIAAGRNALYAQQGRASASAEAAKVRALFQKDQEMSDYYNNKLAGGKWQHMMDQTHIGYTGWQSPQRNIMPQVREMNAPDTADFGVAIDGSAEAWPGGRGNPILPTFDSLNPLRSFIEIFAKGRKPIDAKVTADMPWITLREDEAPNAGHDRRVWVDVDWSKAPVGEARGTVTIAGGTAPVTVTCVTLKATPDQQQQAKGCFASLAGTVAFSPADASANIPVGNVRWEKIPDFGRVAAAMEVFPVTAASIKPGQPAPRLEYPVFFAKAGTCNVQVVTAPTLEIIPNRPLGLAVSIDDLPAQTVTVFTPQNAKAEDFLGRNHAENSAGNYRVLRFTQPIATPGRHTLKISMVDPTVCLQKIILSDKQLPASYFGPPETPAMK
jgi:hypothetical protein